MKFSDKYSVGKKLQKQELPKTSDYWLRADRQKMLKKSIKKKKSYFSKNDFDVFKQPIVGQKNSNVPVPQSTNQYTDANKQEYTGVDKKFQFNNNMMNMYTAAVKNADKRQNYYG
jgi:hypothetical protein